MDISVPRREGHHSPNGGRCLDVPAPEPLLAGIPTILLRAVWGKQINSCEESK